MLFCINCGISLPGGAQYCPTGRTGPLHEVAEGEAGPVNPASLSAMGPEIIIAEVRLASAPVKGVDSSHHRLKISRANRGLLVGIVSVLLLVLCYMAILITVARTAAASSG